MNGEDIVTEFKADVWSPELKFSTVALKKKNTLKPFRKVKLTCSDFYF